MTPEERVNLIFKALDIWSNSVTGQMTMSTREFAYKAFVEAIKEAIVEERKSYANKR